MSSKVKNPYLKGRVSGRQSEKGRVATSWILEVNAKTTIAPVATNNANPYRKGRVSGIHAEKGNVATSPSDVNASEANKTTITPVDKRDILSSRPSAVTSPLKNSPTSINTVTPPAKLIKSNSENNDNTRTITKPLINGTRKKAKNKKRQSVTASFRSQLRKELLQLKKQRLKQKQKIAHDKSKTVV